MISDHIYCVIVPSLPVVAQDQMRPVEGFVTLKRDFTRLVLWGIHLHEKITDVK